MVLAKIRFLFLYKCMLAKANYLSSLIFFKLKEERGNILCLYIFVHLVITSLLDYVPGNILTYRPIDVAN